MGVLLGMRVAVTGATGMLGTDLLNTLGRNFEVVPFPPRSQLDLCDFALVNSFVRSVKPDVIVHTAAVRDVDRVERDPELAWKVNCVGTYNVAVAARELGCTVCYISSDYVFNGEKDKPYHEFDLPSPVNVYGRSKVAAEKIVREHLERYFILRVPLLFGRYGRPENNLLLRLFARVREGQHVLAASDQWSSACDSADIAEAVGTIVATRYWGLYHLAGPGSVSRAGLLRAALSMAGKDPGYVREIASADMGRPAARPRYTVLRSLLVDSVFGLTLPAWEESLERRIAELRKDGLIE